MTFLDITAMFGGKAMALTYGSPEFVQELKKRINQNKEYRKKAKGMNWKTLLIIKDVPYATYADYADGELNEQKYIKASDLDAYRKKVDFVVGVPTYELSVEMAKGTKSLESLFLTGAIKVEGSIFKAMQYREALEDSARIGAVLVNESTIPSKDEFTKICATTDCSTRGTTDK